MQNSDPNGEDGPAMILKDWDIWHCYTNYFIEDFDGFELENIARLFIQNNLCVAVYHSSNKIWWKNNKEIRSSVIKFKNLGNDKLQYSFDTKGFSQNTKDYALKGIAQAAEMRISELTLFSPQYLDMFSYIRGYLNECYISLGGRVITLYPQIKIYDNGVFILSFRIISSIDDVECSIDNFIKYDVNLYQHKADYIEIPPEWFKLYYKDSLLWLEGDIVSRYKTQRSIKRKDSKNTAKIREINRIDFTFQVLHLEDESDDTLFIKNTLGNLRDMIISSLYHVINQTNDGIKYILLGAGNEAYHIGESPVSRPSIYILEFINQPDSSGKIIEEYGNEIGKIITRVSSQLDFTKFLEHNLRPLDDYILYINQALTLWVLSKKELNSNKESFDVDRGHLIYEKQVQAESIDYMYTCYRRYAERSHLKYISYSSSIIEQLSIIKLKNILEHSFYAGELNELHAYAAKMFKLKDLFDYSLRNLKLETELLKTKRDENFKKMGLAISVLFGLASLPNFANEIIKPVWGYLDLWQPNGEVPQHLFFIAIASLIIFAILVVIWKNGGFKNEVLNRNNL
jgi:hypothetical protein